MTYQELEHIVSKPRLSRYLAAAGGKEPVALNLYWANIRLQQAFFALTGIFEVGFRNAVDKHYREIFQSSDWLRDQIRAEGFLLQAGLNSGNNKSRDNVISAIKKLRDNYSHDRLVADLSFGFWINLFAPVQFRLAGQNLHKIFVNRPKGVKQKEIFNELVFLLEFRNRVAHHEPICFTSGHQFHSRYAEKSHSLLFRYMEWLGCDAQRIFNQFNTVPTILESMRGIVVTNDFS